MTRAQHTPLDGSKASAISFSDKPVAAFGGLARFAAFAQRIGLLALIRKYAFLAEGRNDCQDSAKMGFSSDPTRVFTAPRGAVKT